MLQVIGAVGFMDHRLEIPSDTDPEWASMIESCWDRYCFARYWTANSRPCQMIIPSLSKKWLSLCEQWPAMPPLVPRTPWEAPGAAKAERRAGSDATQSSWERCWKDEHQRELASRSRSSSQELPQSYMVFDASPLPLCHGGLTCSALVSCTI
jgi:hypothetical protein